MVESLSVGPIHLCLPADPTLSRIARLAASGLGSLAGFTVDELDDVRLAVSEVLLALIELGDGAPVELDLMVDAAAFEVRGCTEVAQFASDHPDMARCRAVLDAACGEVAIQSGNGTAHIRASVTRTSVE